MKPCVPQRQVAIQNMNTHKKRESRVSTPVLQVLGLVLAGAWSSQFQSRLRQPLLLVGEHGVSAK
jgi:hypothetical protein